MAITLVDHSVFDETNTPITGSQVDENPLTLKNILDGTTTTTINTAATPGMNYENLPYTADHKNGRKKVYNDSGGSLSAGTIVYISGYDATNAVYEVTKAQAKDPANTTLYGMGVVETTIANGAVGYINEEMPLTAQDTSDGTAGRPIFLSGTAGEWSVSLPAGGSGVQIVGQIVTVDAAAGIVIFRGWQIIPDASADQV